MKDSTRITINAGTTWVATIIQGAIGVFLMALLLNDFGQDGYGLLTLAGVIVGLTMILDMGLRGALERHLAEKIASHDTQSFNELAATAKVIWLFIGVVLGSGCIIFAPLIARVFNVSQNYMDQAIFLIRYYACGSIILSCLLPVYVAAITSHNRFDIVNYVVSGASVFRAAGIVAALKLTDTGFIGWSVAMLLAQLATLLVMRRLAYRIQHTLRLNMLLFNRRAMSKLLSLGKSLFTLQLINIFSVKADPIILSIFMGPGAIALYNPAIVLTGAFRPFVTTISTQLTPIATMRHVTGEKEQLLSILVRGTRVTFLLQIIVTVILGVFAKPLIGIWLEQSLKEKYVITASVLSCMAIIDLANYSGGAIWGVLLGMNRIKGLVQIDGIFAAVNFIASVILVGFTRFGILGVVVPTVVLSVMRRPLIIYYSSRICGIKVQLFLKGAYLQPVIVLIITGCIAIALRMLENNISLFMLVVHIVVVSLAWAILSWKVGLEQIDRDRIRAVFRLSNRLIVHSDSDEATMFDR
ncbi:MAG: oligosaccharide flippase family protein [Candidatus Krumholzibacteriota bacterium]|nr:oligosaccharide flippase family protein [Candidatus Krumholzibacteriota bacterium]